MTRVLINVPATAKRGDIIEIKTLISHPMESGYRVGTNGVPIPRGIITLFSCVYNAEEIFRAELSPAIAANPFLAFGAMGRLSTLRSHWRGSSLDVCSSCRTRRASSSTFRLAN
jgi:sulfur-oxidizing protein SoxZ